MGEDEVRATLQAKGADPDCPVCGTEAAWTYVVPGFGSLAFDTGFGEGLKVAALICRECGNVRFHHYETLMGQPPPEPPHEDTP
jgi:hypothetical protein